MSEESKSDEPRLPDELAALEALLAAKPLAAVRIDRDQLLYRAGWAACEVSSPPSKGGARGGIPDRRRTVAWSFASAALAASLAVAGTLGWQASGTPEKTEGAGGGTPRLAGGEGLPQTLAAVKSLTSRDASAAEIERLLNASGRDDRLTLAGPWFAMKQRRLDGGTNDEAVRDDQITTTTDLEPPTAKTARELWKELNPNETSRPTSVWPWRQPSSGDSI